MIIVTHRQRPEDVEKNIEAIPVGMIFLSVTALATALMNEGFADERVVTCTAKHYVKETGQPTVCYCERGVIDNVDHALQALAVGKAVISPSLGDAVEISGVVVGDNLKPLAAFRAGSVVPVSATGEDDNGGVGSSDAADDDLSDIGDDDY